MRLAKGIRLKKLHYFIEPLLIDYKLNTYCIICKKTRKIIMNFICICDSKQEKKYQMRLENVDFRAHIARLILIQQTRYDMNRVYYFPGTLEIVGVRLWTEEMDHTYDVEFFEIESKKLTVFGLKNIGRSMRFVSIKDTLKFIERGYYLLDVYWSSFFSRCDLKRGQRHYLIDEWRKNNKEFFRFLMKKLNYITDPISVFMSYLVGETIVDWVIGVMDDKNIYYGKKYKNKSITDEKNLVDAVIKYKYFHDIYESKNFKGKL